jgi:hypothetical protein
LCPGDFFWKLEPARKLFERLETAEVSDKLRASSLGALAQEVIASLKEVHAFADDAKEE